MEFATHKVAEGILIEGEAVKSDRRVSLPYSPPILPPVDLVSVPRPPSSPASSAYCSGRWRTSGRDADGIAARGGALTLAGGAGAAGGGGSWVGLGWHSSSNPCRGSVNGCGILGCTSSAARVGARLAGYPEQPRTAGAGSGRFRIHQRAPQLRRRLCVRRCETWRKLVSVWGQRRAGAGGMRTSGLLGASTRMHLWQRLSRCERSSCSRCR